MAAGAEEDEVKIAMLPALEDLGAVGQAVHLAVAQRLLTDRLGQ